MIKPRSCRRLFARACAEPWAIQEKKLHEIGILLSMAAVGERPGPEIVAAALARKPDDPQLLIYGEDGYAEAFMLEAASPGRGIAKAPGSVAVFNVFGTISQRMGMLDEMSGGVSTERLGNAVLGAVSDTNIKAIVLNVDSPGGTVYGVSEVAKAIFDARGSKPIIAQANSLMASAAYWIGSAADEVAVTPGGEIGSIGVFTLHQDMSKMYENVGVKPTLIKAGKFKADANPWEPLSEEASAALQKGVDEYYNMFIAAVARGRGVSESFVRDGMGEGRVVRADEAVKLKMANRVATLDETLKRLGVKTMQKGDAKAEEMLSAPEASVSQPVQPVELLEMAALDEPGMIELQERLAALQSNRDASADTDLRSRRLRRAALAQ